MLQKTNPEVVTVTSQIENMNFLIEKTIPWMEANPHRVDLDIVRSDCGTFGCVLGWYLSQSKKSQSSYRSSDVEFGIIEPDFDCIESWVWSAIFGAKSRGTLSDRKTAAIAHRQSLQERLEALL